MKKTTLQISIFVFFLSFLSGLKAQITGTLSIGTGSSTSVGMNWHPIYRSSATSTFDYSRAAFLYDAAELAAAGMPANATITAIEWDKSNTGATVSNTAAIVFNILMKNSAATTYTGITSWGALSTGATAAYATTAQAIPATIGNLTFSLTTPFVFTGGGLEILTDWDISAISGNPTTGGISWNGGANTNHVLGTSGSAVLTSSTNLGPQTSRPNIRIIYSYVPLPNDVGLQNLISPALTGCYGAGQNIIATLKNYGANSQSNIPVTVVVSGAVSQTISTTFVGPIASGATATVNFGTLNMTTAGTYSFNGATALVGDGNNLNDAMPLTTRLVVASVPLPQMVDFTGFSGANLTAVFPNWAEEIGAVVPSGTTSAWTSQTGLNGASNTTARINLYTTTRNEWIVGPKFLAASNSKLSFDAAVTDWNSTTASDVMGSDDKVRVMVSTDCGASFAPIFTISATNSLTTAFTNFTVSLASYAGQNIIVAFLAQDGPTDDLEDYDFHLDNINIVSPVLNDAGISSLVSPNIIGCYGSSENMVVTINNYGSAPISGVPVTVIVSGAATQTSNAVYAGTIAPATSVNFTVAVLNMSANGTYSFNAFTSLAGDGNSGNDNMMPATRTKVAPVSLPQTVDFTGFTGANLPSVFPNWTEATGSVVPTGTTSAWLSQTGLNGVSNVTARINLYTTTRNEWILGPKISAVAGTKLTFDAAVTDWNSTTASDVMGSDDKVRVMVSTDCGVTYAPVFTISATNSLTTSFTNFTVNLSAYAGQNIMVAFLANDGPTDDLEDYDFHLDNINLCSPPVINVVSTNSILCTGNTATITASGASTYSWTGIGSGSNITVTPTVTTTYTVVGSNSGCDATLAFTQTVSACTGINSVIATDKAVVLYPNPVAGTLNVMVNNGSNSNVIEITDALGRTALKTVLNETSTVISVSELSAGVYVYKIINSDGTVSQGKLIKE